ncbi:hypothetical protein ACFU53_48110 [Streptomyces sp. NPDC057474]|uniref:hypothetical protein n=1 Tax=Streptomyces sp. NPDC057474 TaxID=3346144 RepID=UPI0036BF1929
MAHFSPTLGFALAGGAALLAATAVGAGRRRGRAVRPWESAVESERGAAERTGELR